MIFYYQKLYIIIRFKHFIKYILLNIHRFLNMRKIIKKFVTYFIIRNLNDEKRLKKNNNNTNKYYLNKILIDFDLLSQRP